MSRPLRPPTDVEWRRQGKVEGRRPPTSLPKRPLSGRWRSIRLAPMPSNIEDVLAKRERKSTEQKEISPFAQLCADAVAESSSQATTVPENPASCERAVEINLGTQSGTMTPKPPLPPVAQGKGKEKIDATSAGPSNLETLSECAQSSSAGKTASTLSTVGSLTIGRVLGLKRRIPTMPRLRGPGRRPSSDDSPSSEEATPSESTVGSHTPGLVPPNSLASTMPPTPGAVTPGRLSRPVSPRRGNETYLSFLLRRRTRNTARALEVRVCTNQSLSRSLWPLRWIAVQEHVTRELKTRLAKELESALNRRV